MRKRRITVLLALAALIMGSPCGIYAALAATPARHPKPAPQKAPEVELGPGQNPLLPRPIPIENFLVDLSLVPKGAAIAPAGYEPLYSAADWADYTKKYSADDAALPRKKSSGQVEFARTLLAQAKGSTGFDRLVLLRAAIVAYRNKDGFPTADAAVTAYQKIMDIKSPTQVGALWTLANAMARTIATPRADRVRYDAIAAKANMQLTILLLQSDQVPTAQALNKMIAYHEGWVRSDKNLSAQIARVRTEVRQTVSTMDFLATQYQPAIKGDDSALMAIYLYGRFVKNNPAIVADLPGRKPSSPMAQLASVLDQAARNSDPSAAYSAADMLKTIATTLPDGVLKQRTLYAALTNYRAFVANPATERERIKRTLARMAIEGVIADGAKAGTSVHPFDLPADASKLAEAATRPHDTEPTEPVPPGKGPPLKPVPPGTQPSPEPVPPTVPVKPAPLPPGKTPNPSLPGMPSPLGPPTTRPGGEPETPIM